MQCSHSQLRKASGNLSKCVSFDGLCVRHFYDNILHGGVNHTLNAILQRHGIT